ncbi:MAG TPA: hypothetical protein VFR09_05445, partial [Alphaproteobacteria bacterium]|nr:hypothetical protein [Alphaproteobacteria bacterium]
MSSLTELLSASGDAAYNWDMQSDHIEWFGAWDRVFGPGILPPANSSAFHNVVHSDDRHLIFGAEEHTIDRHYRVIGPQGRLITVHERGSLGSENGKIIWQRGILRVVEKTTERSHSDHSNRDPLTNCFTRPHMLAQIAKSMDASKASRRSSAYLVLGIDKMSFVNEAVGTEA